ncbi:MAG: hypothetical protein LN563_05375 [Rickettsia endosymbiont of Platyusa sonomae]|nr:hypothetical protein [Rickettsia endosymbiont of Platyusa sonomae]
MADNFEDDKDNKGKKKDSADFAQIMNVVNDIKGHVKSLNPVTFSTLRSTLADVFASHPEVAEFANIKEIFEQLELALKEEQQRVQAVIAGLINDENKAAEAKRLEEGAAEKLREEIERRAEVAGVYKAFDSFYPEVLNTQRKDNENLHEVFKATKAGRPLTEAEKEEFKKKPGQIAKEKAHSQHMELTKEVAEKEHKYHSENLEKVNKEIADRQPHEHQEIAHLVQKKDYHEKGLSEAEKKKEQYEVFHNERKQHAHNICVAVKLAKEKGINEDILQDFAVGFHEMHGVSHEKMAKELNKKEQYQQAFITLPSSRDQNQLSSESAAILHIQQGLEKKQITPDSDQKANQIKERGDNLKENLGRGKDQKPPLQKTGSITPDPTPVKDQVTGKRGRW